MLTFSFLIASCWVEFQIVGTLRKEYDGTIAFETSVNFLARSCVMLQNNSMGQESSLKNLLFPASEKTLRNLWNPKVHYRLHKISPLIPVRSQTNPVQALPTNFLLIRFNIIIHIYSRVFQVVSTQIFSRKPCMLISSYPYVLHAPPISYFLI